MPRQRKPHRHEVVLPPGNPDAPFERTRAIYTRLSDDDPESVSHAHQEAAARRYAEERGYTITGVYRDWRTGKDPDRLGLKRLIDDAVARRHAGVVFWDDTRLHRKVVGAIPIIQLHERLPAYQFEATARTYDIDYVAIWATMSGRELDDIRRRTMEQRRRRAANGEFMAGMQPYWLDRDPKTRAAVVNPERAAAFLHAAGLYARGEATSAVCRYLTEHAPARTRGAAATHWTAQRLRKALRNPALWGELPYARFAYETEQRGEDIVITQRKNNPDAVPFRVPPLIHKSELERTECQIAGGCPRDAYPTGTALEEAIKSRRNHEGGRTATVEHPLRRRVVCACGWRMWFQVLRRGAKEHAYLGCPQQNGVLGRLVVPDIRRPKCPLVKRKVPVDSLWPQVRDALVDAIRDPDRVVAAVQEAILAEATAEARNANQEAATLDALTDRLADLDARENRLYERWDAGQITKNVYETQVARIASERRAAEEEKRRVLATRVVAQRAARATESLRAGLMEAASLPFERLSLEDWSALLGSLVSDVVLDANGRPSLRWRREG